MTVLGNVLPVGQSETAVEYAQAKPDPLAGAAAEIVQHYSRSSDDVRVADHRSDVFPCVALVEVSDEAVQERLREARVARLATVDADRRPHVVPVCFAHDGHVFYSPLDLKPKRVPPEQLARVRHIQAEPNVVVLIDHYEEDWEQLWYVMVRGTARLLSPVDAQEELSKAHQMLQAKYPQYRGSLLPEDAPIIRIVPSRITCWGKL